MTNLCYSGDDSICSRKYFKLWWLVLIWKHYPMRYGQNVSIAYKMDIISFSYVDLSKLQLHNFLLVNAKGNPFLIKTIPRLVPKESNSRTKVLVKSSIANTRFMHMSSFKVEKVFSFVSLHTKALFFNKDVMGVVIFFLYFITNFL